MEELWKRYSGTSPSIFFGVYGGTTYVTAEDKGGILIFSSSEGKFFAVVRSKVTPSKDPESGNYFYRITETSHDVELKKTPLRPISCTKPENRLQEFVVRTILPQVFGGK